MKADFFETKTNNIEKKPKIKILDSKFEFGPRRIGCYLRVEVNSKKIELGAYTKNGEILFIDPQKKTKRLL